MFLVVPIRSLSEVHEGLVENKAVNIVCGFCKSGVLFIFLIEVNEHFRSQGFHYLIKITTRVQSKLVVGGEVKAESALRIIYHQASGPEVSLFVFELTYTAHYLVLDDFKHREIFYRK